MDNDFEGQGGSYEIVDGKRRLIHRTEEPAGVARPVKESGKEVSKPKKDGVKNA